MRWKPKDDRLNIPTGTERFSHEPTAEQVVALTAAWPNLSVSMQALGKQFGVPPDVVTRWALLHGLGPRPEKLTLGRRSRWPDLP